MNVPKPNEFSDNTSPEAGHSEASQQGAASAQNDRPALSLSAVPDVAAAAVALLAGRAKKQGSSDSEKKMPARGAAAASTGAKKRVASSAKKRKGSWKKPEGMPKRPLSAYNFFFRQERQALLGEEVAKDFVITDQSRRKHRKTHGKIGFAEMARVVGNRWKALDAEKRKAFELQASTEKARYVQELEVWKKLQEEETTETTESMEEDDTSTRDEATLKPPPAQPQVPQAQPIFTQSTVGLQQRDAMFQRAELRNNALFAGGNRPYNPMLNASLPANFGRNAPIMNDPLSMARAARVSLPGTLPSSMGLKALFAAPRRSTLSGDPFDASQASARAFATATLEAGIWRPDMNTQLGASLTSSAAQLLENQRIRQMEERYRMHLAQAASLRERLVVPQANPGLTLDVMRQQLANNPNMMQARRWPAVAAGDLLPPNQARGVDLQLLERAQAARRAELAAAERIIQAERAMQYEEELRKRRGL